MYRPFGDFLRDQRGGATEEDLGKRLNELVKAVGDTGKKGKLVLTIEIQPLKADSGQVVVTDTVDVKLPQKSRGGSVFFATPENNLSRKDPRQQELALRSVETPAQPLRTLEGGGVVVDQSIPLMNGEAHVAG